ncbi:MAG: hypothetical protein K8M05_41905 [Deltaproteobacteria bacterium]|nr:hypothetical protein [Kofleriaceae bacterium]
MVWIGFGLLLAAGALAYQRYRAIARPKPLRNDAVVGLTQAALRRLLERAGSLERAGEVVPEGETRWRWDGDNLLMKDGVTIGADDIVEAAVDFGSKSARKHADGPLTEAAVTEWLQEGVSKAIARFVLGGVERMQERMKIMTRTSPPPTAEELAEMKGANERERAEMDKLLGRETDESQLPRATLRKP